MIEIFYKKELRLSILKRTYHTEPDSNIRNKVKVVLDSRNYAVTKN